ncbi:TPR repeat-containing protein [Oscillochloris trichoides DG-6]|uniref:TPR repeat-containing protein n=1 Tax=Oscillochloris trichoides DG-6 TaxID=765420 RepID=E1IHR6_9CHLR|nr:hypothetical protein [Oscillochloris trichoides]EFO79286.1 TPR repeat-containing protein [Oscillochloris trichoides DG-6]
MWARIAKLRPLLLLLLLGLVADATRLPLGPRAALHHADTLWQQGHYYAALQIYQPIDVQAAPQAALHLGILRLQRGEYYPAERAIRAAMQVGLDPNDYHLALLYLGQALAATGRSELAHDTWALIEDCRTPSACQYRGPAYILRAEEALRHTDLIAAETQYRRSLDLPLPPGWAALAQARLALLTADYDPSAAAELLRGPIPPAQLDLPWVAPLLPTSVPWREQLELALGEAAPMRTQRLGQIYLNMGWYALAETQFRQVPPGPLQRGARIYAAYAHWLGGDRAVGQAQLEAIIAANPDDAQARMLLAMAYLANQEDQAARAQLDTVAQMTAGGPDLLVAWANWHIAQHAYPEASSMYQLAVAQAHPNQRGHYAMLGAQFHLRTTYELCPMGLPLAEIAAKARPEQPATLTLLAAYQYYCGEMDHAVMSAQQALDRGAGAEAAYYLGMALRATGQNEAGRLALIQAADREPASIWRERAEQVLGR